MDILNYVALANVFESAVSDFYKRDGKNPVSVMLCEHEGKIYVESVETDYIFDMEAIDPDDRKRISYFLTSGVPYTNSKGITWREMSKLRMRYFIAHVIGDYIYDVLIREKEHGAMSDVDKSEYEAFMSWVVGVIKKAKPDIKSIFDDLREHIEKITKNLEAVEKADPKVRIYITYMQEAKERLPELKSDIHVKKESVLYRYKKHLESGGDGYDGDLEWDNTIKDLGEIPVAGGEPTTELHGNFGDGRIK